MSGKRGLRCSVGGPNVACLVWAAPASQTLMGESFRRTPMPPRPLLGEASGGHPCLPDPYQGKPQEDTPASQTLIEGSLRRTPLSPRPLLREASGGHPCLPDPYGGWWAKRCLPHLGSHTQKTKNGTKKNEKLYYKIRSKLNIKMKKRK